MHNIHYAFELFPVRNRIHFTKSNVFLHIIQFYLIWKFKISFEWLCHINDNFTHTKLIGKTGHVGRQYFPNVSSESDLQRYKAISFRQNSTNVSSDQHGSSTLSNVPSEYRVKVSVIVNKNDFQRKNNPSSRTQTEYKPNIIQKLIFFRSLHIFFLL